MGDIKIFRIESGKWPATITTSSARRNCRRPPLCAGGADATWNMQWQTVADGKAKDVTERQACGRQR
jgi:hypothetical protein